MCLTYLGTLEVRCGSRIKLLLFDAPTLVKLCLMSSMTRSIGYLNRHSYKVLTVECSGFAFLPPE